MIDTIKAAAQALAAARHAADAASEAVTEAQHTADRPKARVSASQAERASIIAASRGGTRDPDASLRLAVLDADLADLAPMVAEAEAELAKAQAAEVEARQAVVRAEQRLAMATDAELERRLVIHAGKLDDLLLATLSELEAVGKRIGRSRPLFAPSQALAEWLRRLHLTAEGIRR
jgi:septal ring factor EnvC (AmiA/AmiB activator)